MRIGSEKRLKCVAGFSLMDGRPFFFGKADGGGT